MITPYFGRFPVWMPPFLLSCKYNPRFHFLILTDNEFPPVSPENVIFKKFSLNKLNALASKKLGITVRKENYSQVDLKPLYGIIFEENTRGYDFWGHCDIDLIWGDLSAYITDEILTNYDIISSRKNFISGHLNLYRNKRVINELCLEIENYEYYISRPEYYLFDEHVITAYLKEQENNGCAHKIYWKKYFAVDTGTSRTFTDWYGWQWSKGKLFGKRGEEAYIHFYYWKKFMNECDIGWDDFDIDSFHISKTGITKKKKSKVLFLKEISTVLLTKELFPSFKMILYNLLVMLKIIKKKPYRWMLSKKDEDRLKLLEIKQELFR